MPKRKSDGCAPGGSSISITSLDAALDMLACDTFTRLEHLTAKFENAAGIKLSDGVARTRWDEAVRRYWVMKSMDDLCCGLKPSGSGARDKEKERERDTGLGMDDGEVKMEDGDGDGGEGGLRRKNGRKDSSGRALPAHAHPGAVVTHSLNAEEEDEWKRWNPKLNDVVLVELSDDSIWPGKIIDKRTFFQGRTVPRGNHFYCVRIYDDSMSPTVTIKSRLVPLHMRPSPPLLASTPILSAFNHAQNPASFDSRAQARESAAAYQRAHPGVTSDTDLERIKAEKASWNELVNWVMSERRVEKLRAIEEDRAKRLRELAQGPDQLETLGLAKVDECMKKKRKTSGTIPLPPMESPGGSVRSNSPAPMQNGHAASHGIFGPAATVAVPVVHSIVTPKRTTSPSINGFGLRPAISTSTTPRPNSPRKFEKRRTVYNGMGEYSPRGRGGTYTPPRILPSGDETAPLAYSANGSPAPTLPKFDFVSPLGPVRSGLLDTASQGHPVLQRKGSLDVVKEEPAETDVDGWTIVQAKRGRRAGSAPCRDKGAADLQPALGQVSVGDECMSVDA